MTKRYANGELVTKSRIQDEPWYPQYQSVMEIVSHGKFIGLDDLYGRACKTNEKIKGWPLEENRECILRWCVQLFERHNQKTN